MSIKDFYNSITSIDNTTSTTTDDTASIADNGLIEFFSYNPQSKSTKTKGEMVKVPSIIVDGNSFDWI